MSLSGSITTSRRQRWALLVLALLTAGAVTCLALWGPGGGPRAAPPHADQSVLAWSRTAFTYLAVETCDDPGTVAREIFHPRMVEAIEETADVGEIFASSCGDEDEVRGVVPFPDFREYADDPHFDFLATADHLWMVARGDEEDMGQDWLVVEQDGQRWLISPYIHFYALCAAGLAEC